MATIPLHIAQRRLDTGNAPQYPQGSPIGGAMQGLGDEFSAIAARYQQMKDQQEAFDAELARRRFTSRIVQAEDEVAANAPADGTGLHDTMYGQVDPRTGRVVKTGLFDTLYDDALPGMPESQRADFARQKETLRAVGARRMAQRQKAQRDDYELAEWTKVDNISTSSIAKSDPNDTANFEAIRQSGFDLIAKIGNPLARQAAEAAWRSNTAKALVQAMIAQDPKRAAEMLGEGQAMPQVGVAANSLGGLVALNKGAEVSEVSVDRPAPNTVTAGAISGHPYGKATWAAHPWIADLSPEDILGLSHQAQTSAAASLVNARTDISLAYQNAPDALMYAGNYSGKTPGPEDFTAVYGAEEGSKQSQSVSRMFDVGHQAFGMRIKSNEAIETEVLGAKPKPDSATPQQDQVRYETTISAALQVLYARRADPADFVRKVFPSVDVAWSKVTRPDSESWNRQGVPDTYDPSIYQIAIASSVSAQRQIGVEEIRPLPKSVLRDIVDTFNNKDVPQTDKDTILRDLASGVSDPDVRTALSRQLAQAGLPQPTQTDPIGTASPPAPVTPPLPPVNNSHSALERVAKDFGNYLSESAEALGQIPRDIQEFVDDLRDDPLDAIERLPVNPTSGVVIEGAAVANSLSRIFTEALGAVHISGGRKLAKPLEEILSEGTDLRSFATKESTELASAERNAIHRQAETSPTPPTQGAVPASPASVAHDLHVTYMPHWNAAQRAAADLKVKLLTEAVTVVSRAVRQGRSARKIFKAVGFLIPFGHDIDHVVDLQLGGLHQLSNFAILDSSVNRSLGKQIHDLINSLPIGTVINKVTIGER